MSEAAINEYLTKQIIVNHNIVTFRLLSRALSIHVNSAKSALAAFYEKIKTSRDTTIHATWLLTGEDAGKKSEDDSMDVDDLSLDAPSALAEPVPKQRIMVVPDEKLDAAQALFKFVRSKHIYSVEPSPFMDPSLLVTTVDAVRKMDATKNAEDLRKLGIPVSEACKYNENVKPKQPSPVKAATGSKPTGKGDEGVTNVKTQASKDKFDVKPTTKWPSKVEIPKMGTSVKAGGLDWGKAKVKEPSKAAATKQTASAKAASQSKQATRAASVSSSTTSDPKPKRGIKRTNPPTDDDDEIEDAKPPKAKARVSEPAKPSTIRTKRGVVVSDEEDEDEPPVKSVRRKTKSDALMDWSDDEDVVTAPGHTPGPPSSREGGDENDDEEENDQSSLGDDAMELSDVGEDIKYAKSTRAPSKKKAKWPVGANGLRKRRIAKTREHTDARGFLQMEDYSEYESVGSESEQPPDPAASTKKKTAATGKSKEITKRAEGTATPTLAKQSSFKESVAPKAKAKPAAASGPGKKKTLDSFFAKK